jgi:hypothetical protein
VATKVPTPCHSQNILQHIPHLLDDTFTPQNYCMNLLNHIYQVQVTNIKTNSTKVMGVTILMCYIHLAQRVLLYYITRVRKRNSECYLHLLKISHIVAEHWLFICGTRLWDGTKEKAEKGISMYLGQNQF